MLDRFHSARIDVPDLDTAVADYARLLGRPPTGRTSASPSPSPSPSASASETQSVFFGAANMGLELRLAQGERTGQSGIRLATDGPDPRPALEAGGLAWRGETTCALELAEASGTQAWQEVTLDPAGTRGIPIVVAWGKEADLATGPLPAHDPGDDAVDPAAQVHALDHVVVMSPAPEPTRALYADGLGLRLALDKRFEERGVRLLFFRLAGVTIEIGARLSADPAPEKSDRFGGLAWQVRDIDAVQARLAGDRFDVSEVRTGHKPGTRVCTVRDPVHGVPTLLIQPVQPI